MSELLSLPLSLVQSAATSVTAVNQQLPAALTRRLLVVASEQTGRGAHEGTLLTVARVPSTCLVHVNM